VNGWLARHAAGLLGFLVRCRLGRVLVLGQTHGRPMHLTPNTRKPPSAAWAPAPASMRS